MDFIPASEYDLEKSLDAILDYFKFHPRKQTTGQERYREYLRSATWQDIRHRALERDGWTCQCCKDQPATCVHHKVYPKVWGTEKMEWLVSLCSACHRRQHNL